MSYKQREAQKKRTRRYRDKAKGVTKGVTSEGVTSGVTDLEKCQYCSSNLPALEKPRQHVGSCYECTTKRPLVWPLASREIASRSKSL